MKCKLERQTETGTGQRPKGEISKNEWGIWDPAYGRGEKQSFVEGQEKKKKKQVGREVCMETLLTPATGVLFFWYEDSHYNKLWPKHKHWKRPVRKAEETSSPNHYFAYKESNSKYSIRKRR